MPRYHNDYLGADLNLSAHAAERWAQRGPGGEIGPYIKHAIPFGPQLPNKHCLLHDGVTFMVKRTSHYYVIVTVLTEEQQTATQQMNVARYTGFTPGYRGDEPEPVPQFKGPGPEDGSSKLRRIEREIAQAADAIKLTDELELLTAAPIDKSVGDDYLLGVSERATYSLSRPIGKHIKTRIKSLMQPVEKEMERRGLGWLGE